MSVIRPPAGITARPPDNPRWCTLCGTEGQFTRADLEVSYASGETALVTCSAHLAESVTMALSEREASFVTVWELDGRAGAG